MSTSSHGSAGIMTDVYEEAEVVMVGQTLTKDDSIGGYAM